jgi:hypothetical protein
MQDNQRHGNSRSRALSAEGLAVLVALALVAPPAAHAYIDPGSGALIWQALLAAAVGALVYFRRAVGHVKSWFSGKPKKSGPQPGAEEEAPPAP